MTLRILIVDDEPAIHEVMDSYLRKFLDDYELITATTGTQAVEKAGLCISQGHPPDFVLMDLKMPEMNGLECTRILTEMGVNNIHLLTAYFDMESLKQAVEVGAKGVLKKSEGFASVARKVANMVRGTQEPAPQTKFP
ncbi:response regulator [Candidatus Thorarchaeota archaeon]|nr:MAG: response regulator [Candidatus Thorarchaeota archaeon]